MTATTDPTVPRPELTAAGSGWLRRRAPAWLIPGCAGLAVVEAAAIIAQAGLIAWIVDQVLVHNRPPAEITMALGALLAVLLARAALGGGRGLLAAMASARVRLDLRRRLLDRLTRAGPDPERTSGRMTAAVMEQVDALDGYYARYLPQLIASLVIPAMILAAAFSLDWIAAVTLAVTGPLIPLFMALIGMGTERLSRRHYRALARLGGWFLDRIRGAETLRLYRAGDRERARVAGMTDRLRWRSMAVLRVAFLSSAVLEFLAAVAIATVAIYIGLGLMGMITFGPAPALTLFSGLFVLLLAPEYFQPIRTLSQGWHDRADARGALAEIRLLLDLPPARAAGTEELPESRGMAVETYGLELTRPGRGPVLRGLDLDLAPGERVMLTGPSGCGKSTLLLLLAGALTPDAGSIRLNRVELRNLADTALARRIAWLGQHPALFSGTIADNIAMGDPGADEGRIREAARRAAVLEFAADLTDGLHTPVGEDGFGLSGGQIQRIALARVLIRPRPLVLLDEPTASLDAHTERRVLAGLDEWLATHAATVICTGHRPGLLPGADRVLVLRDGRLAEASR